MTTTKRKRSRQSPPKKAEPQGGISAPSTLSPSRKRLFVIVTIAFPFVLLGLLELGLRVFHYGPDLSLFEPVVVNGNPYLILNHEVKSRYFSGIAFRQTTALDYFKEPKPPGIYRIFVLGGSTAVGYPYGYNASFASFLWDRLHALFPERTIEVINLGLTATNSFTVLDLAKELPEYEPDLLLVYDGHNEFYGPLGVGSRGMFGESRFLGLLSLQLEKSKVFLLLRDLYAKLRPVSGARQSDEAHDISLEQLAQAQLVPYGSRAYWDCMDTFRENLRDLCTFCRGRQIPILLSMQVSNLRGQAPFRSGESPGLTEEEKREFASHQAAGQGDWKERKWAAALAEYRAAAAIDSLHAGAHFFMARCLDILGRRDEARVEYVKARDDDQLRFRASSDCNRIIMNMQDSATVGVVDMEGLFMANSPDSLIGNELILEHLHPNSAGYFLMAKGYAEAMRRRQLLAGAAAWAARDTVSDITLWNERTVTELDERIALLRTAAQTSTWPFVERSLSVPPAMPEDTLEQFAKRVVGGTWGVGDAHIAAAEYDKAIGDRRGLRNELRALIRLDRQALDSYIDLAALDVEEGHTEQARTVLRQSIDVSPTAAAYRMLGNIAIRDNSISEAISDYESTTALSQSSGEEADNCYQLALLYLRAKLDERAEAQLLRVLSLRPQDQPSIALLRTIRQSANTPR